MEPKLGRQFSGLKPVDPVESYAARDAKVLETLVELEKFKMLREDLSACYAREQVNHYANCKEQAMAYIEMMHSIRFGKKLPGVGI
mmetsp:Transcript_21478/g.63908  ORF Transcript_21478/g.63908 Transcript_21478/m.63908 type:complete len:86 (+) Transcript_21478:35-292(+)